MKENQRKAIRVDLQFIARMIEPGSRLLDVGCGRGALLEYLVNEKQVDGRGIELSTEGVNACVIRGLSVIQGDANTDLKNYPDDAFDYVVLSQTLQAMTAPKEALEQMLRIGKRAIVSFPNFAHWRIRLHLLLKGRMPVSETLPDQWYDTPNIHFCTIKDFTELCREMGITAERAMALSQGADSVQRIDLSPLLSNLMGEQALFLLKK
ncbi:MAG: methionine biosynthesis protein MetW [Rhodospirillaceae bacterium]|nr:methionine biosynthesis protein MetW [Rhodospirillaceae bacterium]MBT4220581.1 methionine biosynthesis protein MetW [Rhodospirillaceae bacterium]MBT5013638.1 methionine biosynthesis protein MetW [Rhodospirillaceae bacterium]MBT5309340.1 methionine biosynthesis protein MetW [Rhodospirillaceae bacterium]MBT6406589.1 methionine biosynthesis protein MetW [Rhodospirillaceae bacterium]